MYEELISFRAKRSPQSVAVLLPGGTVSYAEFDELINKTAQRLATLGLTEGSRVAVHAADEYVHWLLLLALDRLGMSTASIAILRPDNPLLRVLQPAAILTTDKGRPGTVEIAGDWIEQTRRMPPAARPPRAKR